jgi:hypothetical protein
MKISFLGEKGKTKVIKSQQPIWNQAFSLYVPFHLLCRSGETNKAKVTAGLSPWKIFLSCLVLQLNGFFSSLLANPPPFTEVSVQLHKKGTTGKSEKTYVVLSW